MGKSQRRRYVTAQVSLWIQNDSEHISKARGKVRAGGTRALSRYLTRLVVYARKGSAPWHVLCALDEPGDFGRVDWARVAEDIEEDS